ncbi:hypothetical protein [Yersinia kristensenii]|uniref:hypothetical protein n=1 Tax=Yersinia kristensenii TaxID=28152 RepID=UPI001C60AE08|nr:hypothetical protein [Yersinia kristensenii]
MSKKDKIDDTMSLFTFIEYLGNEQHFKNVYGELHSTANLNTKSEMLTCPLNNECCYKLAPYLSIEIEKIKELYNIAVMMKITDYFEADDKKVVSEKIELAYEYFNILRIDLVNRYSVL